MLSDSVKPEKPPAIHEHWLPAPRRAATSSRTRSLTGLAPWGGHLALALAPHPDDPEAIAVTLRLLAGKGWQLHYAIVTSGWSGVLDNFVGPSRQAKAAARRREQRTAARLFGLAKEQLTFLALEEDEQGSLCPTDQNRARLFAFLGMLGPDLVLLPWKQDSNATHRLVYSWFADWASTSSRPIVALANEDPKTLEFESDLEVVFDAAAAAWKEQLLECHQSQSARNLAQRGRTFASRILSMNGGAPGIPKGHFAERFHAELWNFPPVPG